MEKIDYKLKHANIAFFGDDSEFEKCRQQFKDLICSVYKSKSETEDDFSLVYDFSDYKHGEDWPLTAALISEEDEEINQFLCSCAAAAKIPLIQSTVPSAYSSARFVDIEEERAESEDSTLHVGIISRSFYDENIKKELSEKFPDFKIEVFELKSPDFDNSNRRVGIPKIFRQHGATEDKVRVLLENPEAVAYNAIYSGKADIVLIEGGINHHPLPIAGLYSDCALVEAKDSRIVLVSREGDFGKVPKGATIMAAGWDLASEVSLLIEGQVVWAFPDEDRHNLKALLDRNPDSPLVLPYFLLEENGIDEAWLKENNLKLSETDFAPEVLDGVFLVLSETGLLPENKKAALDSYLRKYESDEVKYKMIRWVFLESTKELLEKSGVKVCAGLFEKDGKYRFLGACFNGLGKTAKVDTGFKLSSLNDVKACIYDFTDDMRNKFRS